MRNGHVISGSRLIIVLVIVFGLLITLIGFSLLPRGVQKEPNVFVGVDIGYGDEEDVYAIADAISGYANLIVLGSLNITTDTPKLTRVCDYLYQKSLYFIVYVGFGDGYTPRGPDHQFFTMAAAKWGNKFLGVYLFDEVGGKLMDGAHSINITAAHNYSEAASIYVHELNFYLGNTTRYYEPANFTVFSSDYALYWYDYLYAYDVVFGEFVGNHSRQLTIALCRGAAKTLDKNWGIMITWAYQQKPFLENAGQLFLDMVLAYENGAKYILVFNSPGKFSATTEFGTLTPEHFGAIKMFWNYVSTAPEVDKYPSRTAYVLPRDYGYGFRGPHDKIWGMWEADALSSTVWNDTLDLLAMTRLDVDVVYETKTGDVPIKLPYDKLIFWNGTIIQK